MYVKVDSHSNRKLYEGESMVQCSCVKVDLHSKKKIFVKWKSMACNCVKVERQNKNASAGKETQLVIWAPFYLW